MASRFRLRGVYSVVKFRPTPACRRSIAAILVCTAFVMLANAQNAPPKKFNVTGTVVNSATGEGIPRAMVTLQGFPARTAFTDSNGGFMVEGVAAGRFSITAQKPGYFGQQERGGVGRSPQFVVVGAGENNVTVKLSPESVLHGRLIDSNDQPVEGVSVRLLRTTSRNGKLKWEPRGYAASDEDGGFRFANLQPGTYYLSAGPEASRANSAFTGPEKPRTGWPGLYYPGVPELSAAAPIRIAAGQQVQADLTMNKVPLYSVAGMVSGFMPGQGVSILVQTTSGDNVPVATHFSSDSGVFDIRLPAGSYRLRAMSQSGEQQLRADLRINVNKDLTQLNLPLQPATSIPIHVQLENRSQDTGQLGAAARMARRSGLDVGEIPPVNVQLVSTEPGGNDSYSTVQGIKGSRTLVLQGVEPGRYSAVISAHGGWYVESATCGNNNILTDDLVITGGGGCSMELLLRNDSGTVRLSVKSSQPQSGGTALLVPVRGRGAARVLPFETQEENAGDTWTSMSLAPGEYMVYAFDNIDGIEYANPEALRPYASQATAVTVSPGETAKVTAQLIQTGDDAR
jgi:hypothetical protein